MTDSGNQKPANCFTFLTDALQMGTGTECGVAGWVMGEAGDITSRSAKSRTSALKPRCLGIWVQNAASAITSVGRQGAPFSVCTRCRRGGHTENPIHGAI